jgi:hypothetical protein
MSMNFDSFFDYEKCEGIRSIFAREDRKDPQFSRRVFDAIAPVAIYHFADVEYSTKAREGMAMLIREMGSEFVDDTLFDGTGTCLDDFIDDNVIDGSVVEDIAPGSAKSLYCEVFAYVAEDIMSNDNRKMEFSIDSYGGFNYLLDGDVVFGSDDANAFPWFDSSQAIKDRYESSRGPSINSRMG